MDKDYWKILSLLLFGIALLVALISSSDKRKIKELQIENRNLMMQVDSLKSIK